MYYGKIQFLLSLVFKSVDQTTLIKKEKNYALVPDTLACYSLSRLFRN